MAVYRDSLRLHTPTPLKQRLARFAPRGPGRTPLGPVPENQSPAPSEPFFDSPYDLSGSFIATGTTTDPLISSLSLTIHLHHPCSYLASSYDLLQE